MNASRLARLLGLGTGILTMAGCSTLTPDPVPAAVKGTADAASLQADVQALQEWRQEVRLEQENQDRDREALRKRVQELEATCREHQQAVKAQIQDLEVARERDRQYVVDELTRKLTDMQKILTPAPLPAAPVRGSGYEHVVKSGETLSEIARAYKVSLDAVLKANSLKDGNAIRAGQKLFIPD